MNKLDGKSMDIVGENIEKLRELFPEVFSEGKIDFKKLEEELGEFTDSDGERYNFTWAGKTEAKKIAQTPSTGTLRPSKFYEDGKEDSKNWDTTQNLYIEGDNLEVLKLLQKSYHKKVKMIYIDPPYNTGKDFVYKDNFHDNIRNYLEITGQVDSEGNKLSANAETNGRYHSDWLNMMYPRLKLARNLLKDDGVIFISIDDNEVTNLRKLCDEIFGEDNFVEQFIWKSGRTASSIYTREHEYVLAYAKKIESVPLLKYDGDDSISDRAIKKVSVKNPASEIQFRAGIKFLGEDKVFPKKFGETEVVEIVDGVFECKNGQLAHDVTIKAGWAMKDMIEKWLREEEVFDSKGQKVESFFFKENGVLQYLKQRGTIHPKTIITDITTKDGTNQLVSLLGFSPFDYPKTPKLINYFLKHTNDNDVILDFFSGSATTAHAVMQLNAEDSDNRKFIMVQLPEPTEHKEYSTICEIGKERIRRAGDKIIADNPDKDLSGLDIGFKVLKLDSSNIKAWDSDFDNLEISLLDAVDNIKSDRTAEDLLYEVLLKYGLDLTLPIEEKSINGSKIFVIGFGALIVCLDDHITLDTVKHIAKLKEEYESEITRVVFKDSSFADAVVKTNALQTLKQFGIDEVVSI